MGKVRSEKRNEFVAQANKLFQEVVSGEWSNKIPNWNKTPIENWRVVIKEFSNRCPGYKNEEYIQALQRCMLNNR